MWQMLSTGEILSTQILLLCNHAAVIDPVCGLAVLLKYARLSLKKDIDWIGAYVALNPIYIFQHFTNVQAANYITSPYCHR